jgi:peroxiredoxin
MIKVRDQAPDFNLKDQNGKVIKLSSMKGKKILLSFRPLAWTTVCHDQMMSLEAHQEKLEKLNTIALGIGVDSTPSNKAWAQSMNIKNTRILSDFWPHGEIAKAYGLFREKDGFSERANVVIDENQKVKLVKVYPTSQLPDIDEIIKFLSD